MIHRRELLNMAAGAGAASVVSGTFSRATERQKTAGMRVVDTNLNLFQWPFRRLPLDGTKACLTKLRSLSISQAWAGSFEGIFHRDIAGVNQRLADACKPHKELVPIGSVNPTLPDWQHDLHRCLHQHHMLGVRLHPNYHQYKLDDPRFAQLLETAGKAEGLVQIAAAMEDTRTQHPLVRVEDVDLEPLVELMPRIPQARVQILNSRPRGTLLQKLAKTPRVFFDTARVDGTDGPPKLVQSMPPGRVLFGTGTPLLIPEAALIRVHESSVLDDAALRALLSENALLLSRTLLSRKESK